MLLLLYCVTAVTKPPKNGEYTIKNYIYFILEESWVFIRAFRVLSSGGRKDE